MDWQDPPSHFTSSETLDLAISCLSLETVYAYANANIRFIREGRRKGGRENERKRIAYSKDKTTAWVFCTFLAISL
jgi:hypothetical protein